MKILTNEYLSNVPDFKKPAKGGPANFARLFFNYLVKNKTGHEWVGIILRDLNPKNTKHSIRKIRDRKLNRTMYKFTFPHELTEKILRAEKFSDPRIILSEPVSHMAKLIKKISPNVVFLNGFSLGNWIILEAARQAGFPIAIQHAGIWWAELEIYKDFFSSAGIKIMKKMEKDSSSFSANEIFLNNFSKKFFVKNVLKGKASNKKQLVIPLPTDFAFFKKKTGQKKCFNFDSKKFNIGLIGRYDRIKNHPAVGELAALVNKKNLPWIFNSITRIPDTKKNLRQKKLYRKNIKIIDYVPKEKIRDFCQEINLMIIPSHFDVSPSVLLEAVACGTPVAISKNIGFVDDFKKFGAKNWIINFNDPEEAIRQIEKIKNRPLPKKLTENLKKKHQPDKIFRQYLSLFKKIIKQ